MSVQTEENNPRFKKDLATIPEWAEEKITQATIEQLEIWGDNILEANTLDEVFS